MPIDRVLVDKFRPVAEAMYSAAELRQSQAVGAAIRPDGTVNPEALTGGLPWQRITFQLPGTVTNGAEMGGIHDFPQGGRIQRLSIAARVAPTTATCTARVVVNGDVRETVSLARGQKRDATGTDIVVPPGGVVTITVVSAGAAEDVTITAFYAGGTA